jgi:hypothetical protein
MTNGRGATTTFAYNARHLPTSITYGVPGGVAATPNVSFAYDAAGNRTSMTDGLGSVSYLYNQLSQLTWGRSLASGFTASASRVKAAKSSSSDCLYKPQRRPLESSKASLEERARQRLAGRWCGRKQHYEETAPSSRKESRRPDIC